MQFPLWCAVFILAYSLPAAKSDITCGEPPSVKFASLTTLISDEYPVGASVTYACQFGYAIDGKDRTSECVLSRDRKAATWTETEMSCIPRSCGDPGYVVNGHRKGSLFTFPNFVTYECDEGFQLRGNAKRYCQASGSWSGRLPKCETLSCDPPDDPENGLVSYSSLEYGSVLKYECNEGYQLTHNENVYCTSDGTWSRTDVTCTEVTCGIPVAPERGSVKLFGSEASPRAGTLAIFSCEEHLVSDGPTTSKCLDIGEWTFPPPQCREPCNVPEVPNGKIGRYVKSTYRNVLVFQEIPVGNELEDDEKLFLHCSDGYEPLGGENWQARVTCSRGKWKEEPYCEPASCRSKPPSANNGIAMETNSKHGGTVYYECFPDFKKVKTGNVKCVYGEWKGVPPVCKDTRCSMEQLVSRGLQSGSKMFYKHGESFQIACSRGYRPSTQNYGRLKCENGTWKGPLSPCIAGSCLDPPPVTDHGRAEVTSTDHGANINYVCESPYILTEDKKVQCLFGEWNGQPPKCRDSRCYVKDLKYNLGVSLEMDSGTNSGENVRAHCAEGYTRIESTTMCLDGTWIRESTSPCMESLCTVGRISNGGIIERTLGPSEWSWLSFKYVRPVIYKRVPLRTTPSRTAELYLTCNRWYAVQGTGPSEVRIHCSYGKWSPDAVCLREGTQYTRTSTDSRIDSHQMRTTKTSHYTKEIPKVTTPLLATSKTVPETTTKAFTEAPSLGIETTTVPLEESTEECSCEYIADDENIVAHVDGKEVNLYDSVKNGSVVKFRCKDVGLQHLVGQQAITCENCQRWSLSDFPTCVNPKHGDAVILYDKNVNISVEGILEIDKGQTIRLICLSMEVAEYPEWSVPANKGVSVETELMERRGDIIYISNLDIENSSPENDGTYECAVPSFPSTTIQLRVIDPDIRCPRFQEEEGFFITYDKETRVGSKVTFSCRKYGEKIDGKSTLTCLASGEWSDLPPQCSEILCKELKETDLLRIAYKDGQKIGSFATFHCFAPGERIGASRARCLENGQWSEPTPTCRGAPCSMDSLFSALPQGIVPNMDDVTNDTLPYNSTLSLTCEEDYMALEGNPLARCGKQGKWDVETVRCIPGCLPLQKPAESNLIVMPEKEVYRFGDFVTFTCPPGMDLNIELELIMCLRGGWSETQLPECIEVSEYEDTQQ